MRKKRICVHVYIREYSPHPGPVGVRCGGLDYEAFALLHVRKESKNSKSVYLDVLKENMKIK